MREKERESREFPNYRTTGALGTISGSKGTCMAFVICYPLHKLVFLHTESCSLILVRGILTVGECRDINWGTCRNHVSQNTPRIGT